MPCSIPDADVSIPLLFPLEGSSGCQHPSKAAPSPAQDPSPTSLSEPVPQPSARGQSICKHFPSRPINFSSPISFGAGRRAYWMSLNPEGYDGSRLYFSSNFSDSLCCLVLLFSTSSKRLVLQAGPCQGQFFSSLRPGTGDWW